MKLTNLKITLPVILLFSLLMACHVNNEKKAQAIDKTLSYTVANNYFVKNNVNDLANSKITTREEFDNLFGMAATMGSNGTPTSIDFENQYVIAVIEPDTDLSTILTPYKLEEDNGNIIFFYKKEVGKKMTYTIRPCLIIIVDKKYTGNVIIREI